MEQSYDVVIVGGGINGCGCAADASLRGLSVLLCEQDDLASKTSSNSTKLIHGGLRYLEYFDFSMVKHALEERERLLKIAPHLIHPLPFMLPVHANGRNEYLISIGLFLYDHLSRKNSLPKHKKILKKTEHAYFHPLNSAINKGYLFYDCQTDDARLVIENALQAKKHGATILTHTALIAAKAIQNQWEITLKSKQGVIQTVRARALINAAGASIQTIDSLSQIPTGYHLSLVQGSHIIVPKLYPGHHAYMIQNQDKRIVFTLPYHQHTLIGTTETVFHKDPRHVNIEPQEIEYLCNSIKPYFHQTITPNSIIATYSGVRTLISENKNPTALSRDYAYQYSSTPAPAVSILSGKITTYRKLAEIVISQLSSIFHHMPASKTASTPLVGAHQFTQYQNDYAKSHPWLDKDAKSRYLKTYGVLTEKILSGRSAMHEMGIHFGQSLYQAEVDYLIQEEWAQSIDDILWRRTKLGLSLNEHERAKLEDYLSSSSSLSC
jgi:glycerol-3-phosphate dehydrogenase